MAKFLWWDTNLRDDEAEEEQELQHQIQESIPAFKSKGEALPDAQLHAQRGEGWEHIQNIPGFNKLNLGSFNSFYSKYINKTFENERGKIYEYRDMANFPEIADVIEDATNESTQLDQDDKLIHLEITDKRLSENENIVDNLNKEFTSLFGSTIEGFNDILWDMFRTYYIDGRMFYERVINRNRQKEGIKNIKKLPSDTMDYIYDPTTGKIIAFFQYLKLGATIQRPKSLEEAKQSNDVVVFEPEQIGFINYGIYGKTKMEIFGYLEKVKIPYNQLKLLETSVVIYRLIRAPERLVFRIDTGNMPRDKALKYVEKIKQKLSKKQTYDPESGQLSMEPEVFSMLENYYLPQSADGRGSQIDSVGGNAAGFSELDDIYYFARKMYRALKYPVSRIDAEQEKRSGDLSFGGNSTGEISRDEIKWAKFLERQQGKFCHELTKLFLLHLEFKGLKREYDLSSKKIKVTLNPPSNYKEQMEQNFQESRYNNYQALADREEISKYFLMKRFLKWSDDDIEENVKGLKKDQELGFVSEEGGGSSWSDRRLKKNIEYL
jgi:hypothetical protein